MNTQPILPVVDEAAVRQALDRLRQARALGNSPLRRLVWVREQMGAVREGSPVQTDVALVDALARLIGERLADLRRVEQLPTSEPTNQAEAWAALRADYARDNAELEAWSLLYHRYVRVDFDWQAQQVENELAMSERNLRRRLRHGIRRLTEDLTRREIEARKRNHRLWLELKLPAALPALMGAEETVARVVNLLQGTAQDAVMAIGPGGIGKTAVCQEVCRRLVKTERFANVVWISLSEPTPYRSLLALIAADFGLQQVGEQDLPNLEAALRLSLERVPTLLVIDNADPLLDFAAAAIRLNQLIGPGRLLLTGRQQPPAETPIRLVKVKPLARDTFCQLVERAARDRRVPAAVLTPETLDALYANLGGNPLAGRLIASQLGMLPLNRIMANLSTLRTIEGAELFDQIFGATWEMLGDDSRRIAITITLLPPSGAYWQDILSMAELSPERLDRGLQELVACSLLEIDGDTACYVMHGLARLFVEDQAQYPPFDSVYREVLHAAIERERAEVQPQDSLLPAANLPTTSVTQTLSLLHRELQTGLELRAVSDLIRQLAPAMRRSGLWMEWHDALERIDSKLRSEDAHPADLCRVALEIGVAQRWLGLTDAAKHYLEEAIRTSGECGDFTLQAEALLELAKLQESQGQSAAAFEAAQRSAAVAHRYGAIRLRRRALIQLIDLALVSNRPEVAERLAEDALRTYRDESPDATMLSTLGMVHLGMGDMVQAEQYQQQALEEFQADGDLPGIGRAYLRLGIVCQKNGNLEGALQALGEGLHVMEQIGDALGRARTLSNLGAVQLQRKQFPAALDLWQEAIHLQEQLNDQVGMAYTWYNLAVLQWEIDRQTDARRAFAEAQQLAERFGLAALLSRMKTHPLSTL